MTQPEEILRTVANLVREAGEPFMGRDVREALGIASSRWGSYAATLEAMRVDRMERDRGYVADRFLGAFLHIARDTYRLSDHGMQLIRELNY